MSEKLFTEAYALLGDDSKAEEEQVDGVESLARSIFPALTTAEIERLVLDILMAHHRGKDPTEAARSQRISVSQNPQSLVPVPPANASPTNERPSTPNVSGLALDLGSQGTSTVPTSSEVEPSPGSPIVSSLKPFDQLRNILGWNNSDEDLERVLAHNDFDFERAIGMLAGEKAPLQMSKEQVASRIMCRYFINGNCARGTQCMYSHDGSTRICRFWLHQRCFLGSDCLFLHEIPKSAIDNVASTVQSQQTSSPASLSDLPSLGSLPKLGAQPPKKSKASQSSKSRESLGSANKPLPLLKTVKEVMGSSRGRVPLVAPRLTPWKSESFGINKEYVDLRRQAGVHAEQRNKILEQSTVAWSANDSALAKKLSYKGREHEQQMIQLSRTAAEKLWEQRKKPSSEIWLDLHAMDLAEALAELEERIEEIASSEKHSPRLLYVITGRGHFKPKKMADFLSQYVHLFLDSQGYKHRSFSVDPEFGRVTAVDPWSKLG